MGPKKTTKGTQDSTVNPEATELEDSQGPPLTSEVGGGEDNTARLALVEESLKALTDSVAKLAAAQFGKSVEVPTDDSHRRTGKAPARSSDPPSDGGDSSEEDSDLEDGAVKKVPGEDQEELPYVDIHPLRAAIKPGFEEFPPDTGDFQPRLFPIEKELTYQRISAKYTNPRADPLLEYETIYCYGLYLAAAGAEMEASLREMFEDKAVPRAYMRRQAGILNTMRAVEAGLRDRLAFIRYKYDPKADPCFRDIALDRLFTTSLVHHGTDRLSADHRRYTRIRDRATATQLAKAAAMLRVPGGKGRPKPDEGSMARKPGKDKDKGKGKEKE